MLIQRNASIKDGNCLVVGNDRYHFVKYTDCNGKQHHVMVNQNPDNIREIALIYDDIDTDGYPPYARRYKIIMNDSNYQTRALSKEEIKVTDININNHNINLLYSTEKPDTGIEADEDLPIDIEMTTNGISYLGSHLVNVPVGTKLIINDINICHDDEGRYRYKIYQQRVEEGSYRFSPLSLKTIAAQAAINALK